MAKKIDIVGAKPKKIEIVDKPKRRISPEEFAGALGATSLGPQISGDLDPIALAELGMQLLNRLRSSGGRPALADATEVCRVPLTVEDAKTLETMVAQIGDSTGAKPSVGQLVSVIVRTHLDAIRALPDSATTSEAPKRAVDEPISIAILQKMLDEQLTPLRNKVNQLEHALHTVGDRSK
jgi:hypothetical protein